MKLNIGCGTDIKEGYINIDIEDYKGVNIKHDLNKFPYPFADNTIEEVYMEHILEHLDNQQKVIEEVYRILKPKCKFTLIYPFWNSIMTAGFGHKFVYSQFFINYFIKPKYRTKEVRREYSNVQFKLIEERYVPYNSRFFRRLSNYITSITKEIKWELIK